MKLAEPPVIETPIAPDATSGQSLTVTARVRKKVRSFFLLSLLAFVLLNASLTFFGPLHFDPFKFNYRGWAWWTMDDLRNHDNRVHNVALLGSSTMVSATAGCEANHRNTGLDLTKDHNLTYLDSGLSKAFKDGDFDTFSLAAPGQMPSDAFLALKAMVQTANRPDVVIYGLAPRDFVDSTLAGPNDTEPFKYFTRIVNIDDVAKHVFHNPFARLDWFLQRIFFIYGQSLDFRMALTEGTEKFLNAILPPPNTAKPFTWWNRVALLPGYLPAEIHPEAVMAGPIDEKTARTKYNNNVIEYLQRYKKPNLEAFKTQMYFLRKLAQYCHNERIELVLVNMPITRFNVSMLPAGVHQKYLDSLRAFAWNNNVIYYDLCEFKRYPKDDFHDSVHLNAFGGKKFFDDVLSSMVKDSRASLALRMAGMQLRYHSRLAASQHRKTF